MDRPKPPEKSESSDDPFGFKDALIKHQRLEHAFTLKLGRPNLYRIDWEQKVHPAYTNKGAVWSAGDGDFIMITENRYSKVKSRELALGAATGVSGGAAHTIPAIFFGLGRNLLKGLKDVKLEKDEAIDGVACHVLSGGISGQRMILWIGKDDYLIRQKRHVLGGTPVVPNMDDDSINDSIKEALKQLNKEITPEAIAEMKKTMRNAREMASKVKGTMTETYRDIVVSQVIPKEAFRFEVPEGLEPSPSPF